MSVAMRKLSEISSMRTGKLNSNAAESNGIFPFFTCAQATYRINKAAFNTEAVLLGGNNANGVFPLKYYQGEFNAYQRTYVIESLDNESLNTRFLYYALRPALSQFQAASIGAATQYLTKPILDNFKINVPDISTQNRVVDVLSAYDNLIENNTRRIELLEESTRQLYKEWFIRFFFPGHEHVKIINGVPDGWERKNLLDVADTTYGFAFKSQLFNECGEGLPIVRIRNIPNRISLTFTMEEAPEDKLLSDGDFLIGMDGDFHMNYWCGGAAWLNQRVVKIAGRENVSTGYLKQAFEKPIRDFNETITGTTVRHLGAKHLKMIYLVLPPKGIMEEANQFFEHVRQQVVFLSLQNTRMAEARDLLLPKLMSGELSA